GEAAADDVDAAADDAAGNRQRRTAALGGHQRRDGVTRHPGDAGDRALLHRDAALGGDGVVEGGGRDRLAQEVQTDAPAAADAGRAGLARHRADDVAVPLGDARVEAGALTGVERDVRAGLRGDRDRVAGEPDGLAAE